MKRQSTSATPAFGDELGIAKAFYEMAGKLFADPAKFAEMQVETCGRTTCRCGRTR